MKRLFNSSPLARRRLAVSLPLLASLSFVTPASLPAQEPLSEVGQYVTYVSSLTTSQDDRVEYRDGQRVEYVELGPLTGAPEIDPPLKYLFRSEDLAPHPGNAATHYRRAMLKLERAENGLGISDAVWAGEWTEMPRDQLPMERVEQALTAFEPVREELELASRCTHCDWEIDVFGKRSLIELLGILLDEQQECRSLARLLAFDARESLARGNFDRAADDIRLLSELARDLNGEGFLITGLISVAIHGISFGEAERWIKIPNSPNLYWALTSLSPSPFDPAPHLLSEMRLLRDGVEAFRDPESREATPEEWLALLQEDFTQLFGLQGIAPSDLNTTTRAWVSAMVVRGYPIAKQALLEEGFDPEQLERMPAAQVFSIYESRAVQRTSDLAFRRSLLPPGEQSQAANLEVDGETISRGFMEGSVLTPLVGLLLPATSTAAEAAARPGIQLAALRTLEAIRMHVATTGSVPESLDQIKVVPVPQNPRTGQPFEYRVLDNHVELIVPLHTRPGLPLKVYRWTKP